VQVITLGFNQTGRARGRRRHSELDVVLRMCEHIAGFMQQNDGGEFKAFFSRDGGTVGLYLVTTAEVYDFELGDKLAAFTAPYIERGLLGSVTLLPASTPEELAAYFDPMKALRVEIRHA
jgi:hypothetical protein